MFIIPFFGLLGVARRSRRVTLGFFATVSLVALWLERYLLVMPSVTAFLGPVCGWPEAGVRRSLFAGLFLLCYALFARTFPMLSPRLAEITLDRERGHAHAWNSTTKRGPETTSRRSCWSGGTSLGKRKRER